MDVLVFFVAIATGSGLTYLLIRDPTPRKPTFSEQLARVRMAAAEAEHEIHLSTMRAFEQIIENTAKKNGGPDVPPHG